MVLEIATDDGVGYTFGSEHTTASTTTCCNLMPSSFLKEALTSVVHSSRATGMHISAASRALLDVSRQAEGLSGRLLRKLPLLALAFNNKAPVGRETTLAQFLTALSAAIFDRQH